MNGVFLQLVFLSIICDGRKSRHICVAFSSRDTQFVSADLMHYSPTFHPIISRRPSSQQLLSCVLFQRRVASNKNICAREVKKCGDFWSAFYERGKSAGNDKYVKEKAAVAGTV